MSEDEKLSPTISPEQERFARILFPHFNEQYLRVRKTGTRFVHYTNAEAAMGILRGKNIWMRASSCMNDVSEVRYGLERLWKTYRESNAGKQFRSVLNGIFPGSIEEIEKRFNGWTPELFTNTFLTCFSEHRDEEDYHGRLSMWRAYGKAAGIALVIKNSVLLEPADGLGAYSSPVAYLNDRQFEERFAQVTENVSSETEFLRTKERKEIINRVFNMLRFAALSTKHPAFEEEKEWRVLYTPSLEKSRWIAHEVIALNGVPQWVYKLPLENIAEVGLVARIPDLLDRVIIGPTGFPIALFKAFEQLLTDGDIKDADKRIALSGVPLRHSNN
jgi:Protein of unknown function (DUF2971)